MSTDGNIIETCKKCGSNNVVNVTFYLQHCRTCDNWQASFNTEEKTVRKKLTLDDCRTMVREVLHPRTKR